MMTLAQIAQALGGKISAGQVLAPGPGHSRGDRSMSVSLNAAGDDIVVHSFCGDDDIECKDFVRKRLGMPAWQPNGKGNGHRSPGKEIAMAMAELRKPKPAA